MSVRMKLRDDDNGRRRKNTLQEAFGPYARGPVEPLHKPVKTPAAYWALYAVAVVALVLFMMG
jgi:hypothetical protein